MTLARDATTSGDPVLAENYLQHAEHYNRIIMAFRDQQIAQGGPEMNGGVARDGRTATTTATTTVMTAICSRCTSRKCAMTISRARTTNGTTAIAARRTRAGTAATAIIIRNNNNSERSWRRPQ